MADHAVAIRGFVPRSERRPACTVGRVTSVRSIERLGAETEEYHAQADADALQLLGAVTAADYRRFLARVYGFLQPLERSLAVTAGLDRIVDTRRFTKAELLRRDLQSFRMSPAQIDQLPHCTVPLFESPEEALGWAYPIERSTLGHTNVYRHLASAIPGDVAFTSSYLKCYFGMIGESWKLFGDSIDAVASTDATLQRVVDAARTAFRTHRAWRERHEDELAVDGSGDSPQPQPA
jgi:heme oxygenase